MCEKLSIMKVLNSKMYRYGIDILAIRKTKEEQCLEAELQYYYKCIFLNNGNEETIYGDAFLVSRYLKSSIKEFVPIYANKR